MEKFTLSQHRLTACLLLLCLFIGPSCRKDRLTTNLDDPGTFKRQRISESNIQKWLATSPAAKMLTLDWKKAQQAVIKGKNVVRIPTVNIDRSSQLVKDVNLKLNPMLASGAQSGNRGKTAAAADQVKKNEHYYNQHPPEVFFVEEPGGDDTYTFLLNFVPTNPGKEFGEDNLWTGNLYEWNLAGDTLLVQELNKSSIVKRYGLKLNRIGNGSDKQALSSANGTAITDVNGKKVSGAWADFWRNVGETIAVIWGDIGNFFGVATWDNFDGRYEWDAIDWSAIGSFFDGIFGGGGGSGYGYTGSGSYIYDSYIPGYQSPDGGGSPSWEPYPYNGGGTPQGSQTIYSSSLSYLRNYIVLTEEELMFLQDRDDIAIALENYLESNSPDPWDDKIALVDWAATYLNENRDVSFDDFNILLKELDVFYNDEIINDSEVDLILPPNLNPTFSSNGHDVFSNVYSQDYPESHPVSQVVKNYNPWIYYAFIGSNNTSIRHFHQTSKALSGGDGYSKAIGAIGEGLFVSRVTSFPVSPKADMFIGFMNGTTHIDALQVNYLPKSASGYYGLNVNYTDLAGNPLQNRLSYPQSNTALDFKIMRISYEVKTLNPNKTSAETLYRRFKEGIDQTIHRSKLNGIDASVLVFDLDSWNKLYHSNRRQDVVNLLNYADGFRTSIGELKIYLRLEKNLWVDANRAFFDLIGRIKKY